MAASPKGILVRDNLSPLNLHQEGWEALPRTSMNKAFPETSGNFSWRQSAEEDTREEWGKAERHFEQFSGRIIYNLYGTN